MLAEVVVAQSCKALEMLTTVAEGYKLLSQFLVVVGYKQYAVSGGCKTRVAVAGVA